MDKLLRAALLAGTAAALFVSASGKTCTPETYGALHDGQHDDTAALQQAIDSCGAGDVILLGQGTYLSRPLTLGSGDTFKIAKGAVLLGTADHTAYAGPAGKILPLLIARNASDITLTGGGTIDGNGSSWWTEFRAAKAVGKDGSYMRPHLIVFNHVTNLKVTGLTLQNSPMFHLVPQSSNNVVVEGVTIKAPADAPNTDGIDPSGRDMLFQNLTIDVGDDNIAIKSDSIDKLHPDAASANMVIKDCSFLHGHGLSIGSGTKAGVQNILAENIHFNGTMYGIRVKTDRDRGGLVRALTYRNITMENVGQAILITSYYPKIPTTDAGQPIGPLTPDMHEIRIEHLKVLSAERAGGIFGLPERPLHDIAFIDVTIKAQKGLTVRNASARLQGTIEAESGPAVILQENGVLAQKP